MAWLRLLLSFILVARVCKWGRKQASTLSFGAVLRHHNPSTAQGSMQQQRLC
jgi:hypothetical protein